MNEATNFPRRALAAAALTALLCAPHARASAPAQKVLESARDLSAPVEAGSRVTYLDLVRLVFPDAEGGEPALATRSVPLSHADGDYADKTFTGRMQVDYVERVFIRSGGERLAALLIHVSPAPAGTAPPAGGEGVNDSFNWGGISVLAVYRLTPVPRLLGALDVRGDRETSLWKAHPVTLLGARDSGVWFVNAHHNAGEEFRTYALAAYGAGGLKLALARPPALHSWRACRRAVTPRASVEAAGRRGSARRDLTFVVSETVERFAGDCRSRLGRARRHTYRHLFRWDARRGLYAEGARPESAGAGRVPRVGTIKDYPATGLTVGCGNSYFVLPGRGEGSGENYVFLSNRDGDHAWMNLDGRDTRLTPLRAAGARSEYRAGATRISVRTETTEDDTYSLKLTIVLRRGRARRVVRAVGYADC